MPSCVDLADAGESITIARLTNLLDIAVPFFSKESVQTANSIVLDSNGKIKACHVYVEKNTPMFVYTPISIVLKSHPGIAEILVEVAIEYLEKPENAVRFLTSDDELLPVLAKAICSRGS